MALQGFIEIGGVGAVMLLMVDFHRPRIDVGLQGVVVVSKLRELEGIGHGVDLLSGVFRLLVHSEFR
jgi:hypothetical protein